MSPIEPLPSPDAVCDGGTLDCGSGLLLILRNALVPLVPGGVLLVRSLESSVKEDLPAWCRMVGHQIVAHSTSDGVHEFYLKKKGEDTSLAVDLRSARDFAFQVRVRWDGPQKSRVFARNHEFRVGAPVSFETRDEAPTAMEYFLGAVGGALIAGLEWRLTRRQAQVFAAEVSLDGKAANILVFLGLESSGSAALERVGIRVFVDTDAKDEILAEAWNETVRACVLTNSLVSKVAVDLDYRKI